MAHRDTRPFEENAEKRTAERETRKKIKTAVKCLTAAGGYLGKHKQVAKNAKRSFQVEPWRYFAKKGLRARDKIRLADVDLGRKLIN